MCFLCGTVVTTDADDYLFLRTFDCQYRIQEVAKARNDEWGSAVLDRISYVIDLPAADALYHQVCNVNFRTFRNIPLKYAANTTCKRRSLGRPVDEIKSTAFYKTLDWLENNEDEVITVQNLLQKMRECMEGDDDPYSRKYMNQRLKEHYGDDIIFTENPGKDTLVTLQNKVGLIIDNFYKDPRKNCPDEEKKKIILTAAQLIREEIKLMMSLCIKDNYPHTVSMGFDHAELDVPDSLKTMISHVIPGKEQSKKRIAVSQAIMQAAFPRKLMMPLHLGLAVHLHDHYASTYLIEVLSSMGFCKGYKEVRRYEKNAALTFNEHDLKINETQKMYFMADNIDHNPANLDEKNTVHWMGMALAISPVCPANPRIIHRLEVSNEQVTNLTTDMIHTFNTEGVTEIGGLMYTDLTIKMDNDKHKYLDLLWKCKQLILTDSPLWSGLMQAAFGKSEALYKTSVTFLPMIDLPPTDLTCVYSTLKYIAKIAKMYHKTPVCTFDQALWWKGLQVLSSSRCNIESFIIRLGEFHTRMNFLGCIGYIMANTGLREAIEVIYAENTVPHLLSGKDVDRAWRAHQLIDISLNTFLLKEVIEGDDINVDIMEGILKDALKGKLDATNIGSATILNTIKEKFDQKKKMLKDNRTANFWLQYLDLIDILKQLIRAERLGNWKLHLEVMFKMLPYFAACGHNNYTKSVWLYLHQMSKLESTNPSVFADFMNGYHVIHCDKERVWAGVSPDQVIEQTLMRSLKSTGGLTRGTGFDDAQRNVYIFSRPACAEVNTAMQEFTGVKFVSSDQYKDLALSRIERDKNDIMKMDEFFQQNNPFTKESKLKNIVTGVVAKESVNIDKAAEIGIGIMERMKNQVVSKFVFKTSWKAVNMAHKINITSATGETISIDPNLLFQRLTAIAANSKTDLEHIFSFELCPYAASLAKSPTAMHGANKPKLVQHLHKFSSSNIKRCEEKVQYVIDGGDLLYKMGKWKKGSTYQDIAEQCVKYVTSHYGKGSVVVFDGYPQHPTTKDPTHMERSQQIGIGPDIQVTANAKLSVQKEVFLSNTRNKQSLINLLSESLEKSAILVKHAPEDADLLTSLTATEYARTIKTVVIGEDTDILVLLWHYNEAESFPTIYQTPNRCWDMHHLIENTPEIRDNILLQHAFLGCDTVSRIFGIGKDKIMNTKRLLALCQEVASTFYSPSSTKKEIENAGIKLLLGIYNRKFTCLNKLRHKIFMEKIGGKRAVKPEQLPPTMDSARMHFFRVYHQVQTWLGYSIDALEWGWKIYKDRMFPQFMTQPPAPAELLIYIQCGCKEDGCASRICSCLKHGVPCSLSCSKCNGVTCANSQKPEVFDEID